MFVSLVVWKGIAYSYIHRKREGEEAGAASSLSRFFAPGRGDDCGYFVLYRRPVEIKAWVRAIGDRENSHWKLDHRC